MIDPVPCDVFTAKAIYRRLHSCYTHHEDTVPSQPNRTIAGNCSKGTYNPPVIIANDTAILSRLGSRTFLRMNIGRIRITTSVAVFMAPLNTVEYDQSMHEPCEMLRSQNFSTGRHANVHWNAPTRLYRMTTTAVAQMASRSFGVEYFRYNHSIDSLLSIMEKQ
jgi:hypothetical protein